MPTFLESWDKEASSFLEAVAGGTPKQFLNWKNKPLAPSTPACG